MPSLLVASNIGAVSTGHETLIEASLVQQQQDLESVDMFQLFRVQYSSVGTEAAPPETCNTVSCPNSCKLRRVSLPHERTSRAHGC